MWLEDGSDEMPKEIAEWSRITSKVPSIRVVGNLLPVRMVENKRKRSNADVCKNVNSMHEKLDWVPDSQYALTLMNQGTFCPKFLTQFNLLVVKVEKSIVRIAGQEFTVYREIERWVREKNGEDFMHIVLKGRNATTSKLIKDQGN